MSDTNVTVKVEAKGVGDLGAPFKGMTEAVKLSDKAVAKYADSIRFASEQAKKFAIWSAGGGLGGGGGTGGGPGGGSIFNPAGAGRIKEGIEGIKSGLMGLAISSNQLPAPLAKTAESLNAVSSAAALLKGAGGLAATLGGPVVLAATAAAGAFAIVHHEIEKNNAAIDEAVAKTNRLKAAAELLRAGRASGFGTEADQIRARAEFGIRGQFGESARRLEETRAGMMDRALFTQTFGVSPAINPLQEGLRKIGDINVVGKPVDTLQQQVAAMQQLASTRGGAVAPELRQEQFSADQAEARARAEAADAVRRQNEFLERQKNQRRLEELRAPGKALEEEWKEYHRKKASGAWFGDDIAPGEHAALLARQGRLPDTSAEQRRLDEKLNAGPRNADGILRRTTAEEGDFLQQQVLATQQRLLEAQQRQLEIKNKIRQASVEELRTLQQATQEQAKMAKQVALEQEARLRGAKVGLGLSTPGEIGRTLALSRKIAGGGELSRQDIEFAQNRDIFREALERQGERRAAADPRIQEIVKNLGLQQNAERARQAEARALKLDATIKDELTIKVQQGAQLDAKAIIEQLAPAFEKAIADMNKQRDIALEQMVRRLVQEEERRRRDANGPNAPG